MRLQNISLLVLLGAAGTMAFGYVIGSSNLGFSGYPSFESKTSKPNKPYSKDEWAANQYRIDVERYVRESKDYIEAAENDIKRIKEEQSKAVDAANAVVREYNSYIRYGY